MFLEGAKIHNEGVTISLENEIRIREIVQATKLISSNAEINLKFLKYGKKCEVLLWGSANDLPIGIYSRGFSIGQALETAHKKLMRYGLKARALTNSKPTKATREPKRVEVSQSAAA